MEKTKYSTDTGLMTREQLLKLAGVHGTNCVSIFIPTERAGGHVDEGHGQLRLKNSLKEVGNILDEEGLSAKEKKAVLGPVEKLLDNVRFWRNQSDGLAVYTNGKEFHTFTLPVHFRQQTYVRDHYYMLPVIPYFNDDGIFYLLSVSMKHVKLYECSKHFIGEIVVDDLTPGRLEDVVGYDFEQKSLQNRSGHGGDSGAMFHGQGAGKDDKGAEKEKFFRAVDNGVMQVLKEQQAPLVLACVDEYYPVYKKVTAYSDLSEEHISGNPDEMDPLELHEEGWLLVEDHFRNVREEKKHALRDASAGSKASSDVREIIPAAVDRRIDTLFIEEDKDLFGIYDMENRTVELAAPGDRSYQASLYNLAAVHTLLNGGEVFISEAEEMPLQGTELNALLRY
ncbi:MAG: hypothetical protein P1P82_14865 [Bacteroidales bacterium]|nr:hypothetical protein [Bacteroidales bacterium]MDT8432585.1 hypothetical protein [Bacteroidales bacterium]